MKKLYLLFFCLFTVSIITAQEELSQQEKDRRQKNIQAGNPFAKLGSKAKVATLSNGKYLEVQDLDSIVTIGTVRFNVDRNEIVGFVERDTLNPDAQPIGDVPSRWISPDPLSEEFSEWSPYTFVYNNPIKFTDPTGMAPEECCPGLKGFVIGMVDNIAGTHYRNNVTGGKSYDNGVNVADALSFAGGTFLATKGLLDMGAGTTGLAASATVTAATLGASIEITGPTALGSTGLIVAGAVETLIGGNLAINAMDNMKKGDSSGGSSSEKTGKGRGTNNRTADDNAVGDHTVRNKNGSTTYTAEPNNPKKNSQGVAFKTTKRVDYTGAPHTDKATGVKIPTPHVQENGTTRPAIPGKDMPK